MAENLFQRGEHSLRLDGKPGSTQSEQQPFLDSAYHIWKLIQVDICMLGHTHKKNNTTGVIFFGIWFSIQTWFTL